MPKIINRDLPEKELNRYCYVVSSDLECIALSVVGYLTNFEESADKENFFGVKIIDEDCDIYKIENIIQINGKEEENIEIVLIPSTIEINKFKNLFISTFFNVDKEKPISLVANYIEVKLKEKILPLVNY